MKWIILVVLALTGFGLNQTAQAQVNCVDYIIEFEENRGEPITFGEALDFCDGLDLGPTPSANQFSSPSPSETTENDEEESSGGTTIAIIAGVMAAVVILGGGAFLAMRRRY